MKKISVLFLLFVISFIIFQCSVLKQIENVSRLKYKLNSVGGFRIMGIDISNKNSISDFSVLDAAQLMSGMTKKSFPASFDIYIDAFNPNNGTGGYPRQDLDIVDFKWRLFIDNVETVSGNIPQPISVPGVGEATRFGIRINLDLYKFFSDKGYDGLLNLALKLGGLSSSPSHITLRAQPTIKSMFGNLTYPREIDIIDREFR